MAEAAVSSRHVSQLAQATSRSKRLMEGVLRQNAADVQYQLSSKFFRTTV